MSSLIGAKCLTTKTFSERKTDCQSRARTSRRKIERDARRNEPKRARPKTAKGFSLTPQNLETE